MKQVYWVNVYQYFWSKKQWHGWRWDNSNAALLEAINMLEDVKAILIGRWKVTLK